MLGCLSSAGSGPLTWMLSYATLIEWTVNSMDQQHPRKENKEEDAAENAKVRKEKQNENQSDQHIRGRPGEGPALLYRSIGLCQEERFEPGPISLADRGLARGAGRR